MTRILVRLALAITFLFGDTASIGLAAVESAPAQAVQTGERLTYEISWLNILAGTAVMEVMDDGAAGNSSHAKLVTTAQSRPAITKFFPVDNRVESEFDLRTQLPQHMVFKRREGKNKEDFEYTFHHQDGTVTAGERGKDGGRPTPT